VFFIHKPYWDKSIDAKQLAKWKAVVGPEKVLELTDPKAVVDVMLGAIAIIGQTRSLPEYLEELANRNQSPERLEQVENALALLGQKSGNFIFPSPGEEDEHDGNKPPKSFICPITQEIMNEPVMCSDGYAYDKEAIEFWLSGHTESPSSGAVLTSKTLTPYNELKQAIQAWKTAHGQ